MITPSPWQARFIYRMIRAAREHPGLPMESDPENDWDDATLMAAAPLLLAACQKLQEYFDTEGGFDLNDARDMADDAVRAALPQPEEPKRG